MKRKAETAASLRGIISQLRIAINSADIPPFEVRLTISQAKRIESALKQFERFERILTVPEV